jgi:diguanylate cyclase (GGDEF)-like protein/PAS domain S-box-containing protein
LLVIRALESRGHRVTHALDGAIALEKYITEPPDLVLMDLMMPNMDGIEATRRIKAIPVKKWIPISIVTGLTSNQDLIRGLEAGADDYLTKPLNIDVLIARMHAKQRIVDMQNNYFAVLENVHEGVLSIDQKGTIQRFNCAAEKIFGYTSGEAIGRNVSILMPEPNKGRHDGYLHNYLSGHSPKVIGVSRKVEGQRKNGELFPMRLSVTEIDSAMGIQFVGLVCDISQEEADRKRIEHQAMHDALTGLYNRSRFIELLSKLVLSAKPFALLFIDVDGFKPINDTFGHDIGDEVLMAIAQRMLCTTASNDVVARLGGDEFVVILPDVKNSHDVNKVAVRLLEKIGEPMSFTGCECCVGASIGAAIFPDHGTSNESILSAADGAMYRAKRTGKNRVVMTSASVL